jgi:hypothetical protein
MLDAEMHNFDANGDPVPTFPTDAEIEMAEQLRRQLEERYLGPAPASAPEGATQRIAVSRQTSPVDSM